MSHPLLRALEDELHHLRQLRQGVLDVLADSRLSAEDKVSAIEHVFQGERDQDEENEEARDRDRLS
jgi:hypothetical protein